MLAPNHELRKLFSKQMRGASPCLLRHNHEGGDHLFLKPDGKYITWNDACETEKCVPENAEEVEWLFVVYSVHEDEAELFFNSGKPVH